jgi:hypothetical protein
MDPISDSHHWAIAETGHAQTHMAHSSESTAVEAFQEHILVSRRSGSNEDHSNTDDRSVTAVGGASRYLQLFIGLQLEIVKEI